MVEFRDRYREMHQAASRMERSRSAAISAAGETWREKWLNSNESVHDRSGTVEIPPNSKEKIVSDRPE